MPLRQLLRQGVSGGGLAQAQQELHPRDGEGVRREGQGAGGVQDYQDGKEKLHQSCHYDQDKSICQRSNLKEFH